FDLMTQWKLWSALAVVLVVSVGAVLSLSTYQRANDQAAAAANRVIPRAPSVVARVNVPAGSPLNPDDFEVKQLPAEAVPINAVTSPAQLEGKVLKAPLTVGRRS